MDGFTKYSQTLSARKYGTLNSERLTPLEEKYGGSADEEHEKNQALRQRVRELEGNMKMLEKKYRVNLKEGFENKIKSFRIQNAIERKAFKQSLEHAKRQVEEQQLEEKMRRAQQIRESETERMDSISLRLQERRRKVRSKAQRQRQELEDKIKQQEQRLMLQNKEAHDRIFKEVKHNDLKKRYMQRLQRERSERETSYLKQECVSKILQNQETLLKLKAQLSEMAELSKTAGPFITL